MQSVTVLVFMPKVLFIKYLCNPMQTVAQIGIDIHKCSPVTWETSIQSTHNTQCMVIVFPHTNWIY